MIGLIILRFKHPEIVRPFRAWWSSSIFFLVAAVFLLVIPFIRPAGGIGDTPPIPYYVYPLVGIAVFVIGFGELPHSFWKAEDSRWAPGYWFVWRVALPRLGRYHLEPIKNVLEDGTIVTQVGSPLQLV